MTTSRGGRGLCAVCGHPKRDQLEVALAGGEPQRAVGRAYGISEGAIRRHRANHRNPSLVVLAKARDLNESTPNGDTMISPDGVLGRLEGLFAGLQTMLAAAELAGNGPQAVAVHREMRLNLELVARIGAEWLRQQPPPVFNLETQPDYIEVRTAMIVALGPYPEARQAVVDALGKLGK